MRSCRCSGVAQRFGLGSTSSYSFLNGVGALRCPWNKLVDAKAGLGVTRAWKRGRRLGGEIRCPHHSLHGTSRPGNATRFNGRSPPKPIAERIAQHFVETRPDVPPRAPSRRPWRRSPAVAGIDVAAAQAAILGVVHRGIGEEMPKGEFAFMPAEIDQVSPGW